MAKLFFKYGAMGSSKTAEALMVRYNYQERGKNVILLKTNTDTRDGVNITRSRIGLEADCTLLNDFIDVEECKNLRQDMDKYIEYLNEKYSAYDSIILDECQFASVEQIDILSDIVDFVNIPVMCFGLRCDFQNKSFPGSLRLLEIAESIEEVKTICWCGRKALCNARYNENGIVREGKQVELGSNDSYVALCRIHYKLGKLKE